ncbi:MAG TPA: hypothetical protein VGH28_33115 [Polyangiaceae bacterium]|jgi:hypothetical protein
MGARAWAWGLTSAAALAIGCGGAADSTLLDFDSGGGDDGGFDFDAEGTDSSSNCGASKCPVVPAGFAIVKVSQGSCDDGWQPTDIVSAPTAGPGACACSCEVGAAPICDTGAITRAYDDLGSPTCNIAGAVLQANQGACSQTGTPLFLGHAHYEVDGPPASGGKCTFTAKVDTSKLDGAHATLCAPPPSCPAVACDGGNVCVAQDGDVACPSGFAHKTLVGTGVTATCSDCGACAVTATCAGKMKFFSDAQCSMGETDFDADGVCKAQTGSQASYYYSYEYEGSVENISCGTATSTATADLEGKKTVCCQQ